MSTKHYDLTIGEFLSLILITVLLLMTVIVMYQGNRTHQKLSEIVAKPKDTVTIVVKQEKLIIPVNITSYNANKAQCDSKPDVTADGHKIKPTDSIIGVSRDLINFTTLHFGDTVTLWTANRKGRYVLHDLGNARLNHVADILIFTNDHVCEEGTISITR